MKRRATTTGLAERLAALSEPIRLRICRLLERHELSVGEVANVVQLPQSTVSRHLKVLSSTEWVLHRAEGTAKFYRLVLDDLPDEARAIWRAVRDQLGTDPQFEEDAHRLAAVLAERKTDSLSFFGRVAGEWDKLRMELFGDAFTAHALLGLLPPDWIVADIGCGTGNAAEMLAPHVAEVVAIDRSSPMLSAAQKRLSDVENVRFVEASIESLPLDDDSVDAATCLLVLHHVERPVDALREMARIVRPGGRVLVVDMEEHDRVIYRQTMGHEHLGFGPEGIRSLFAGAGLSNVLIRHIPDHAQARGPGLFVAIGEVGTPHLAA
ncbi:MAG: metalloregulator ArsR/SmtB family transcription factor [Planctomycetota bacterium]